jgi:hypothetical protein
VGLGQARRYHIAFFRSASAHTEYTRILAEHGLLGLVAFALVAAIAWRAHKRNGAGMAAVVCSASLAWVALFLVHAAMRLAAPALMFGLACARYEFDDAPRTRR